MSTHFRRFAKRVWEDMQPCLGVLVFVLALLAFVLVGPLAVYCAIELCMSMETTAAKVLAALVSAGAPLVLLRIGLYLLQIWDDTEEDKR